MTQYTLKNGTRQVEITGDLGVWAARLYVNNGETATLQSWKGKTEAGARR
jgi:hypothetical protein